MDAEDLKRIHGADVELNPDTSEDEHLTEEEALSRASAEGIEFFDVFTVEGSDIEYASREAAVAVAEGKNVIQTRHRK